MLGLGSGCPEEMEPEAKERFLDFSLFISRAALWPSLNTLVKLTQSISPT